METPPGNGETQDEFAEVEEHEVVEKPPIGEVVKDEHVVFDLDKGEKATADDVRGSGPSTGRKFASDKPTISEIKRLKRPNTRKCVILLDSGLSHQMDELEREIENLDSTKSRRAGLADTTDREIDALMEDLEVLQREAEEVTVEFTFQDIGRRNYDDLVGANKPTDEEKKEYADAGGDGVLAYSTETFPPSLINRTAIDPTITLNEAKEIFDDWSEGDLELLFTTALLVCKEPTSLPKSRAGIAKIRASRQNSTTAPSEESPTPSS